jgi:hypothetical protein
VIVLSFVLGIAIVYESSEPLESEIRDGLHEPIQSISSPLQDDHHHRYDQQPQPADHTNLTEGFQNSSEPTKIDQTTAPPRLLAPKNQILQLFKDFASISNRIILWIVSLAPWCIAFLIAGSLSQAGEIDTVARGVGVYVLATITGIMIHMLISLPIVFFLFTGGENPYLWMYACRQAILIAFSTSSSVSFLPPLTLSFSLSFPYLTSSIGCNSPDHHPNCREHWSRHGVDRKYCSSNWSKCQYGWHCSWLPMCYQLPRSLESLSPDCPVLVECRHWFNLRVHRCCTCPKCRTSDLNYCLGNCFPRKRNPTSCCLCSSLMSY